jgi:putative acetyltransferase
VKENISTIQIRMAVPGNAPAIASVLYESFAEYKALYTTRAFAAATPTIDETCQRLSEGPVWVALKNDTIVGTASAVQDGRALYIRGMAILPAERGQGIGELLVYEIARFARGRSCERLLLSTTPFLTHAIRLYERVGFQIVSEGPRDLFGTSLFTMEKNLEPSISSALEAFQR